MENFLEKTDQVSTKHKNEIVTEFGEDQATYILGVYGLTALSVIVVLQGQILEQIVCVPVEQHQRADFKTPLYNFAAQYCWMAPPDLEPPTGNCTAGTVNWYDESLLDSREIIDTFPKLLLLFAIAFLIPKVIWDHRVGGSLRSYLLYLQMLIDMIKAKLESVPKEGKYGGTLTTVFDEKSAMFDKRAPYTKYASKDFAINVQVDQAAFEDEFGSEYALNNNDSLQEVSGCTPCLDKGRPKLDADKQVRKSLTDRDIFSHLCYRNFAHLPAIPFIQSVQRVTHLSAADNENQLEKDLREGNVFPAQLLWCITKMWSTEKNFGGRVLWKLYLIRLLLNLAVVVAFFITLHCKSHLELLNKSAPADEFCCSVDFGEYQNPRTVQMLCKAPTAVDIPHLIIAAISVFSIIGALNLWKLWEFYIRPNSQNMGAKFLSYTLDDPLSYCQYWLPNHRQVDEMTQPANPVDGIATTNT